MKDENRKLLREKAENEQMIKLLETQKEVLTKSVRDPEFHYLVTHSDKSN